MRQLGQLDLQLTFMGARSLSENVKDQSCSSQYSASEGLFKVALLTGAQRVIKNHQLSLVLTALSRNFF
jgi:hypothetical protein